MSQTELHLSSGFAISEIGLVFVNIKSLNINTPLNCVPKLSISGLSLEVYCPRARESSHLPLFAGHVAGGVVRT